MLHQVVEYARSRELAAEPGFAPKDVRWAILCGRDGRYLGIVELGDPSLKRNPGRHFLKAPDFTFSDMKAGGITKSHFLIETAGVIAAYGKEAPETKHRYFLGLLENAATALPMLEGATKVLQNGESLARLRGDLESHKAKPTDKVTFQIDGKFPVESEAWHEWWRELRQGMQAKREPVGEETSSRMVCFLTGELVEPAKTHPKITGLTRVGGLAMGDVLVGFKQDAFRSFGLEQSANSAMSELAAKAYQAGLNDLIANHGALLAGTIVVHWFRSAVPQEDDPLDAILGPRDDEDQERGAKIRARRLLEAIRKGERPDLANNTYFALTLSSNGGRVVVRDWMEGSFEELALNVNQWFSDLEIVHRDGSGSANPPKLAAVLGALVRDLKDVPGPIAAKLYRVAVRGEPIPFAGLAQAFARTRIDVVQGERPNHARMGLIKAYHMRLQRQKGDRMEQQLGTELHAEFPSVAYQCGRLMAVLASVQMAALGDVGAGVVQRYYAAASTTPALVFGRLVRGSQFHLSKISTDRRGLAVWFERQIQEICGRIGTAMPATLDLTDQSLFALGYYQQQAARWAGDDKEDKGGK
jgi:CRISPR-associated protein Csd1